MKPRFEMQGSENAKLVKSCRTAVILLLGLLMAISFTGVVTAADSLPTMVLRLRQMPGSPQKTALPARDPFNWSQKQIAEFRERDPPVKTAIAAGLTLNAIIWEPNQALAVINGKITGAGERIMLAGDRRKQATILEIMIEKVIFEIDGAYHTLWLEPASNLPATPENLPIRSPIGNQTKGTNRR